MAVQTERLGPEARVPDVGDFENAVTNPRSKARIEARIRERVAYAVEFELSDPRAAFITLTRVEVSNDLGSAKIFYTVLGESGARSRAAHMLEDATGFIRRQLGRVLRTRRIPGLTWIYDESIEEAARVEQAIDEALRRDRSVNAEAHDDLLPQPTPDQIARREAAELESEIEDFLDERDADERGSAPPAT